MIDLQAKINEIKAKHLPVFSLTFSGVEYIYRAITRKEFRLLQTKMVVSSEELRLKYPNKEDEYKLSSEIAILKEKSEEEIVTLALISPSPIEIDSIPAGVVTRLADLITAASGFIDEDEKSVQPKQL